MSIREKIIAGEYETKLPYPKRSEMALGAFAEKRREYTADIFRLERGVFKADLEAEHGLTGHPKANLLFDKAWEDGHASGLEEVEGCYSELSKLVDRSAPELLVAALEREKADDELESACDLEAWKEKLDSFEHMRAICLAGERVSAARKMSRAAIARATQPEESAR